MARKTLKMNASVLEAVVIMAEGNPGAVSVLEQLFDSNSPPGATLMLHLDDMNIRGQQIWVGYKDYCKQDIERFKKCVLDRDQGMVSVINNACLYGTFSEHAVTGGASFARAKS